MIPLPGMAVKGGNPLHDCTTSTSSYATGGETRVEGSRTSPSPHSRSQGRTFEKRGWGGTCSSPPPPPFSFPSAQDGAQIGEGPSGRRRRHLVSRTPPSGLLPRRQSRGALTAMSTACGAGPGEGKAGEEERGPPRSAAAATPPPAQGKRCDSNARSPATD